MTAGYETLEFLYRKTLATSTHHNFAFVTTAVRLVIAVNCKIRPCPQYILVSRNGYNLLTEFSIFSADLNLGSIFRSYHSTMLLQPNWVCHDRLRFVGDIKRVRVVESSELLQSRPVHH